MADETSTPGSPPPDLRWRLDGRVAWVTRASSGAGARFARVLHQAGATVLLTARRDDASSYVTGHVLIVDGGWTAV